MIIEVKNIVQDGKSKEEKDEELKGTFEKSFKQRERTKLLLDGLVKQIFAEDSVEQSAIFGFSAFPSTNRNLFQNMGEVDKTQILCREDFLDFTNWWKRNITDII